MSDAAWVEGFKTRFAGQIVSYRESAPNEPEFTVKAENVLSVLEALKALDGGAFDHLADLTAYDTFPKQPRFTVVYELISMRRKQRCSVLGVVADDATPSINTVTNLWSGANWLEREVYDMFGVRFIGHPDMRRILLPEAFTGYPLRKDFIVDHRQKFPQTKGSDLFDPFGNTIVEAPKG